MRDRLLRQAVRIARTLNPEMVGALSFTAADKGTPAFEFIRNQMTALGRYISQRGIYSMALHDGGLVFGPENYPEDDPMASPPGTAYEEPAAGHIQVFTTGQPAVFGPTTDEYGTFVSAVAPVIDRESGKVVMAVAIDALAQDWQTLVDAARRQSVLASLILAAVLLGIAGVRFCWTRYRRRSVAGPESWSAGNSAHGTVFSTLGRHADTGLLAAMGVLTVVFLAVVLTEIWHWTRDHINATAVQQTRLTVEFDKALRDYVGRSIRPEMEKRLAQGEFIPETMSTSFVARSVFDNVRKAFPAVILRFPSTNPRNPVNRATPSEESLIRYFQQHPQADTWSGTMEFFDEGQKYVVWALPRRFEAGCLQCHGRPEDAPGSLLERYGPVAGFGRSVGEVSLDLAAVPVSDAYARAEAGVWRHMLTALVLCMLFLGGIIFLIWSDARRRRRVETAIERERHFLRLVIDSIPGFICVKSREGRFVLANEALAKAYGTTVQGVEGRTDEDFSPSSEQIDGYWRDDLEVITSRKTKVIQEEAITHSDGTTHWLTTMKVPLLDEDGGCNRLLAVAMDVTQRKRAEENLRESFSLLKATLESTADGLLVVDEQGKIKDYNRQFQDLWNLPDDIMAGRDNSQALSYAQAQLRDSEAFLDRIRELYQHPECESQDTVEFKDGRIMEFYSKPHRLGDQIVGRVWSFRDITEKHGAEQKQAGLLRQVAEINEELTHFAYVVSHDLKAPLRGIRLITEWLCADYGDKLGPEAQEQLDLLQSRVARMHNLIEGVLQYSRVGRIKEEDVSVDLHELMGGIIDGIAAPEHIRIEVASELPVIEGEKTRITQVFQNLLSNAVKFMDKPAGLVQIGCVQEGPFWRFSVSDNGPGIEEKHFDRIFKLFQTLASRDEFESTGVGLAVVKKIVEMYGGRIWVESKVGAGSTFLFTMPVSCHAVVPEPLAVGAAC